MLTPLHRSALADQAVTLLREQLEAGRWEIGERLPSERELSEQLGVGRSTVREAIRVLVNAGWIETRQGSGTYVRSHDVGDADLPTHLRRAESLEVFEVRNALEVQAAGLAAERRDEDDLLRIESALRRRRRCHTNGRAAAFVDADVDFHTAVVRAAHNSVLVHVFDAFTDALRDALTHLSQDPSASADTHAAHAAVALAIRNRDVDGAISAAHRQLHPTEKNLKRLLSHD